MSLKSILTAIEHFPAQAIAAISTLFNSAQKAWTHLSPEIQDGLKQGSGVIATINAMLNSPFAEVVTAITTKFGISADVLQSWLQKAAAYLKIGEDLNNADIETLITNFQAYFKAQDKATWQKVSSLAAQFIAALAVPGGTPFSIIVSFIEIAYGEVKELLAA